MEFTEFEGKVALITGAASGMGLLFAENIASLGGNAVMCDVNEEVLFEKVEEINKKGKGKAIGIICDVREYENACMARDEAVKAFGRIDILANFAGGTAVRMQKVDMEKYPEFPDVPIEVYDWGINVNFRAQFYFAHAVAKQMREQKSGIIINIGSISGMEGDAYHMEYPAAKSGVMYGLTKGLAQFGAKHNIRCVCISPGPVLTRPSMAGMRTLLGRAAEPQEIIDICLFVASEKGKFINGENILIDGGRNAMGRWR